MTIATQFYILLFKAKPYKFAAQILSPLFTRRSLFTHRSLGVGGGVGGGVSMSVIVIGFLLIALNLAQAQTLRGTVRDADNGDAVIGATVALRFSLGGSAPISLATSPAGEFVFEAIRVGYYSIEIIAQGFENQTIAEVNVTAGKELILDIALRRAASQLAEVTISATQTGRRAPLPLGEIPLTRDQTLRFPATFFDPARLAMAYPGVANTDDQANGLSIRGNSPSSVRWRLEGVDIVNPNHLTNAGTFSDRPAAASGGILMFSAQLLDNSSLLTGAFPAGYGDALGGIMDMNLRKGNNRQHEFTAQAGLIGLDLAAEGPMGKKEKNSYLVNYRYSTVGLLGQLGVSFGDEQINFQDLSFNLNFQGKRGGRWSVFGLGGLSENIFKHKTDTAEIKAYKDFFDIDYESKTGVLGVSNWSPLWRNAWVKSSLAVSGQATERYSNTLKYPYKSSMDSINESKLSASITFSQRFGPQFRLSAGASMTQQDFFGASTVESFALEIVNHDYLMAQPWANLSWKSGNDKTFAELGLHALFFSYASFEKTGRSCEPRFNLTQILSHSHRISLSAGKYSQMAPFWLLADDIDLMQSWKLGLAYAWKINNDWGLKAETFYQRQTNAGVDADMSSTFSLLNELEYGISILKELNYKGLGENKGLELSAERRISNGWFMLANLTLFDSRYQGSDGVWRDTRWNARHLSNLVLGKEWQREKSPGKERTIGLNIRAGWTGGGRGMPVLLTASQDEQRTIFDTSRGFSEQSPDYFRLDLRVYWRKNLGNRRNSTFALDVQNLTGQQNFAYHYYDPYTNQIEQKYQLGTIPNFSWRLEF